MDFAHNQGIGLSCQGWKKEKKTETPAHFLDKYGQKDTLTQSIIQIQYSPNKNTHQGIF